MTLVRPAGIFMGAALLSAFLLAQEIGPTGLRPLPAVVQPAPAPAPVYDTPQFLVPASFRLPVVEPQVYKTLGMRPAAG